MKRTLLRRKTPLRRGGKHLKRSPLARQSPKAKKLAPQYRAAKAVWWAQHDGRCEMKVCPYTYEPVNIDGLTIHCRCQKAAEKNPHHMKKRGQFLCDTSTFLGLCREHHIDWLHNNEEEARRLGYLTDRPAKTA